VTAATRSFGFPQSGAGDQCVIHTPHDEPLVRVFYELYADRDTFDAHENQPHSKLLQEREQYLAGLDVTFLDADAGKVGPQR
jgi:quinol monooxygenase YgiN